MNRLRRRLLPLALVLALALVAPIVLMGPARAQIPMLSNGLITATNASVSIANTTSEQLLFQYPIPGGLFASWTSSNNAFASPPLHLALHGTVRNITGANLTIGISLGGSTATMVVPNGMVLDAGTTDRAAVLDVYIIPIATVTTQNCTDLRPCNVSVYMRGRFAYGSAINVNNSTESAANGFVLGTTQTNQSSVTLNVVGRWSAAASANQLNIYGGTLTLGN